jgi:hypothetical protein
MHADVRYDLRTVVELRFIQRFAAGEIATYCGAQYFLWRTIWYVFDRRPYGRDGRQVNRTSACQFAGILTSMGFEYEL